LDHRPEKSLQEAFKAGKDSADRAARRHASALARDLAAAEAAARVVQAEEVASKMAMDEVKTAARGAQRNPFRPVPCKGERDKVVACYEGQRQRSKTADVPFATLSLKCQDVVALFEKCADAESSAMVRPGTGQ